MIMKKSELVRKTLKASQAELSDRCRNREALTIETSADELDRIQHARTSIGAKRLAAVPWAVFCIVCQEAADRMASDSQDEDDRPLRNAA